jgi:hypothetical protein
MISEDAIRLRIRVALVRVELFATQVGEIHDILERDRALVRKQRDTDLEIVEMFAVRMNIVLLLLGALFRRGSRWQRLRPNRRAFPGIPG